MGVDFVIRSVADQRELKCLAQFLVRQSLWYPGYADWVHGVCVPEIDSGYKKAIVAYSRGEIVGDAIFQPHKELPRTREFKNLRVNPDFRRMDLGHFLTRQVEEEGKGSFDRIICDADARLREAIWFMRCCGYSQIMQTQLYCSQNVDVVLIKELSKSREPYVLGIGN
jgi:GNAT superfamily N-acetyltransferase